MLFAGQVRNWHELVTAVALATGAVVWSASIRRVGQARFTLSPAHAVEWARAMASLAPAIVRTAPMFSLAAWSGHMSGCLLEIPFRRGAADGAADAGRRAAAVLIASLGPDNFVVCAPPDEDGVLMHAIVPSNASRDARWLNQ